MSLSIRVKSSAFLFLFYGLTTGFCLCIGGLFANEVSDSTVSKPSVEVIVEKVVTEAVASDPLGAGSVELVYLAGHGPLIYPDQRLLLEVIDQRARYITFNVD